MKIYRDKIITTQTLHQVQCNCCGKILKTDAHNNIEDFLSVSKRWGYNSEFDNQIHSFDLCQQCYKKIIKNFNLPVN